MAWGAAIAFVLFACAAAVPYLLPRFDKSGARPKCRADLRQIASALEEYATRNDGRFPDEFAALIEPDADGYRYISSARVPRDPWKSPYVYVTPRALGEMPSVYSLGPDGQPGTDDDIRLDDE